MFKHKVCFFFFLEKNIFKYGEFSTKCNYHVNWGKSVLCFVRNSGKSLLFQKIMASVAILLVFELQIPIIQLLKQTSSCWFCE